MRKLQKSKNNSSLGRKLLILNLVLTVFGMAFVFDASYPLALSAFGDKFFFARQHLMWAIIGWGMLFVFSRIHYSFWEKNATPLFLGSIVLLCLVFVPGFGTKLLGAKRWLTLGTFSLQPSEFVKLTLAIYLAKVASKNKSLASFFLPIIIVSFLIMLEPDLGTTLVLVFLSFSQVFVSGINIFYLIGATIAGLLSSFVLIITSDYRRDRLMTFLKQTQDPLGKAYHIRQILYALGAGGIFGV